MSLLNLLCRIFVSFNSSKFYSESWAGDNNQERNQVQSHQKIKSIKEIQSNLKNPKETLVIFDVDYVLTHPNEPAYQFPNFAQNIEYIREVFQSLTPLQRDIFANLMVFDDHGTSLVEDESPSFIKKLQNQGHKTIALTASLTSHLEGLNPVETRFETLKKMGIDFSSSFPKMDFIQFKSLIPNRDTYPLFHKGILFSNGENLANQKGAVLKGFLEVANFRPKRVIILDDRKPNLDVISDAMKEMNIEVIGCQYIGSLIYPSAKVDKEVFENKWQNLVDKAIELSRSVNQTYSSNDS